MLKRLGQIELAACVLLLAAITGLVFAAALLRFVGRPLTWSVDMAQLLFIWLCMLGANRAMREKSHIGMEVLARHFGRTGQFAVEMVCSALIIVFLAVLAVEGTRLTLLNLERTFGDSSLSYAWVTAAVPAGSLLLAGSLAHNMIRALRHRAAGMLVYTRTPADGAAAPVLEL
jgi:TRAP-type C4-dicarboxylate transport system permease small subunit